MSSAVDPSGLCARAVLSVSTSAVTTAAIILFTGNAIVCEICQEEKSGPREAVSASLGNGLYQNRIGPRPHWRRAMQVGLHGRGAGAEARTIDLQVLHHTLHVVARLRERDAFDPVDRIDLRIARVAVLDRKSVV